MQFNILVLAVLVGSTTALAADYKIDTSHSNVGFTIRHLVSKVPGEFKDFEGSFSFDPKKPEAAKVMAKIKTASISTNNDKRDEHLRSSDFFDAQKFQDITFVSNKVSKASEGHYKVMGDMTLRGVTKPVTLDVEFHGTSPDPWGGVRSGFSATGKINRKDFGMTWNKSLDKGGFVLGDDVMIQLNVEAIEEAAKK